MTSRFRRGRDEKREVPLWWNSGERLSTGVHPKPSHRQVRLGQDSAGFLSASPCGRKHPPSRANQGSRLSPPPIAAPQPFLRSAQHVLSPIPKLTCFAPTSHHRARPRGAPPQCCSSGLLRPEELREPHVARSCHLPPQETIVAKGGGMMVISADLRRTWLEPLLKGWQQG